MDEALNGLVSQIIAAGDVKGKLGETQVLYSNGALPAQRVLITGLGKQAEFGWARRARPRLRPPRRRASWASPAWPPSSTARGRAA